jgi:uncharacterized protein (DUF2062 family)
LRETIWPRAGWRRVALYVAHRVGRLPGTPYRVAAGFACGAAVSFLPFIGFHFILGATSALILRGNIIASAVGTAVGNPWTFPLIWAWIYSSGRWILGEVGAADLPRNLSFQYIFEHPFEVLWPMTVGGVPTAIVVWFAVFFPAHRLVAGYQHARRMRRARRWRKSRRAAASASARRGDLGPSSGAESREVKDDAAA